MSVAREEYILDTPYTWGFYAEFSPVNLNYIAMMGGLAPVDLGKPFRFLELGCGNGLSLNIFAASNPNGAFHGVDLNPEHIENARRLAREGQLENVSFHQIPFAEFLQDDIGTFDFVALHGVYSWVGPEVRANIRDVIAKALRPGGFAFVSYNALPGWAPIMPMRQIMLAYTSGMDVSTTERVRAGLRYLRFLKDSGTGFFQNNPPATQMLENMEKLNPNYLAHEYFHKYWTCFYFQEVAEELAECDLAFAGSIPSALNIQDFTLSASVREVFRTAPDRVVYETHKSFVLNEMFRRDLYARQPATGLGQDTDEAWGDVLFGPLTLFSQINLTGKFPVGSITYSDQIYPVLARLLSERALTFAELRAHPDLSEHAPAYLLNSLHFLIASQQFAMFPERLAEPGPSDGSAYLRHPLNRAVLTSRLVADGRAYLASPALGGGIAVDLLTGLSILAVDQTPPDPEPGFEAEAWAHAFLTRHEQTLHVEGKAVTGRDANLALLKEKIDAFRKQVLPRLLEFGVMVAGPKPAKD